MLYFISPGCLGGTWYRRCGGVESGKGECGMQSYFLELGPQPFCQLQAMPLETWEHC